MRTLRRSVLADGGVASIPLTKGYEAEVDAGDILSLGGFSWRALIKTRTDGTIRAVYAARKARAGEPGTVILMHRSIIGAPDDLQVDHLDGNGLNNRRSNLRLATPEQNQWNRRRPVTNKSGVKGVYWNKARRLWHARITVDGRRHHLGEFPNIDDAAAAYAAASGRLHGEFGRTA